MIKRKRVKTYIERMYCDKCETEMSNELILTSYSAQYSYGCENCKYEQISKEQYPKTIYIEV